MQRQTDFFVCLNCGRTQVKILDSYWRCEFCNVKYKIEQDIPILVQNWERLENEIKEAQEVRPGWYHEKQPPEQASPWRHHLRKRREYVEKEISRYLEEKGIGIFDRLLDLGCGDGNHLEYLQKYTRKIYGSDYNLTRLVRSRLRFPKATLFLADILDYPTLDLFFDVVFFNHVIEHISEDSKALDIIYNKLKSGGMLILGTPNEGVWWWQLAYKLQANILKSTDHINFYTAQSISKKLVEVGFEIQEVKHLGWGPPHWGLDSKIRKYKWIDDVFEFIGKILIPNQASSLYVLAIKPEN